MVVTNSGNLILYGQDRGISWTRLAATAYGNSSGNGQNFLVLQDDVEAAGWQVGDEIVIANTDFFDRTQALAFPGNPGEDPEYTFPKSEVFQISSISGSTITLSGTLEYDHYSGEVEGNPSWGSSWKMEQRAEVGNLTRSVIIEGTNEVETGPQIDEFVAEFGHVELMLDGAGTPH
ncbi:MAG: hypothetical protein DWQ01_10955, partial [Planctomycetota bacterium]